MKNFKTLLSELELWMPKKKDTLGIPRKEMPQIQSKDYDEFKKFLDDRNIGAKIETVDPSNLKASQGEFDTKKVEAGISKHDKRPIIISNDNYVIDGHHRWLQAVNAGKNSMKAIVVGTNVKKALLLANRFPKSFKKNLYEMIGYENI